MVVCAAFSVFHVSLLVTVLITLVSSKPIFNVRTYGAVGDGVTFDTEAIRSTANAVSEAAGYKLVQ